MATPTIRGHQGIVKAFVDGEEQVIDSITRFSMNQDASPTRQFFVGNPYPEGDTSYEGWSGTIDLQVRNAVVDDLIDRIVDANHRGLAVPDVSILLTERYTDGTSATWAFFDVQLRMSRDQSGLQEKITKRLDVQASVRQKVT